MPANVVSTGAIDTSPVILNASDTLYPDDRKGTLARINSLPSGATVDNIFYFSINGEYWRRVIDGPMSASYCGVYSDGTDQTANLAAAFAAGVRAIVFDNPQGGTYVINGTLNVPAETLLKFYPGNKMSGTGTINKGLIDADYNQQIFETTLTLNPEGVAGNKFSVKWYGAKGNGTGNDAPAIQKTIDLVIRNSSAFKTVWFPDSIYRITEPLIAANWDGTNYQIHTVYLEGDGNFWPRSGIGPMIITTDRQNFVLGIQQGKGCKVKGLQLVGGFVPPYTGATYAFYSCLFENFTDGVSRDNRYSPYSGIVIDPFARSSSVVAPPAGNGVPLADRYPAFIDNYRGTGGNSGSTGTIIEDVLIDGFVVGICSSPSGTTSNAELTHISKYQFKNVKLAISGGQAQEKVNKVEFAAGWGNIHTFFSTSDYGATTAGNWFIEEINLAGNVNRFINNIEGNWYPTYIKKVFAESLGTFGTMTSSVSATIESSVFNFQVPWHSNMIQYHIDATGVKFINCVLRHYNSDPGFPNVPIVIKGRPTFENVSFNLVPLLSPDDNAQYGTSVFINCTANSYRLGVANTTSIITNFAQFENMSPYAPLGSFKTYTPLAYTNNGRRGYEFTGDQIAIPVKLNNFTISISIDRSFVITLSLANLYRVYIGAIVYYTTSPGGHNQPMGVITAIDGTTGAVTIRYAASTLTNGSYDIMVAHPLVCGAPFLGDIVTGTNTITNVKVADGREAVFNQGIWIKSPAHVTDSFTPYVRITGWNSTTRTLTVSSQAQTTEQGVFFCNEGRQYHHLQSIDAAMLDRVLQKGGEFSDVSTVGPNPATTVNGVKQEFVIIQSGYLNPAIVSDTRRAYYSPKYALEYNGNPEGILAFPSGAVVRNRNTGEVYIKTTTDNTQENGGKTGWIKQRPQLSGSITANASVVIPTGEVAGKVIVTSTTAQSGLLIGTSSGGSELGSVNFPAGANQGAAVTAAVFGTGTDAIHFTNVTGTVNYRIILE